MRQLLRGGVCAAAMCLAGALFAGCSLGSLPALPSAGAGAGLTLAAGSGDAAGGELDDPFSSTPPPAVKERAVIANPTEADVLAPGPLPEMSWGRPDAPVTIVEYASLTCPYCRRFHFETFPELRRAYIGTGKVRYILREFPIGRTSGTAAVALRCAPPEKYLDLFGRFLAQQPAWVSQQVRHDAILAVASQAGLTRAQFDACLANQSMIEGLKQIKERGRTLGVIGTPNFFVAGRLIKKVLTIEEIRALVDPLLAQTAQAHIR